MTCLLHPSRGGHPGADMLRGGHDRQVEPEKTDTYLQVFDLHRFINKTKFTFHVTREPTLRGGHVRPRILSAPATKENHMNIDRCCESRGLFYAHDRKRCWRHATTEDRALVNELDERGKAIGLKSDEYGLLWPYGPNIDVPTRARMLAWAETYELRLARPNHRCLRWLRKGRCGVVLCRDDRNQHNWMDHVTTWKRGGKPAVLVGQPYGLSGEDAADLARLDTDPDLEVEITGDAWYGHGTTFVGIWRSEAYLDLAGAADVIAEAREDLADQVLIRK